MANRHMQRCSTSQITREMQINTTMRLSPPTSQICCHQQINKQVLARMWRKGNPFALLVGMQTGAATGESSMELPQKIKNRTAIYDDPVITLLGIYLKKSKTLI